MGYQFRKIEKKWQEYWKEQQTFKVENTSAKPKYYVLDMFPYPSGSGLHVGHPLGYIASDIYARFKRHEGYNVLHPMGYDAYGLPAEQYAIQTGTHPQITTDKNIERYREQLDRIGFSFDWSREVRTSDPFYYKWTQWTFIRLFNAWYNKKSGKAEDISSLISEFERSGNVNIEAACDETPVFSAQEWKTMTEHRQQEMLMNYRLVYLSDTMVNWCQALGTVLANDEVKDGRSERGGHPVEKKLMRQWSLRITAYAQRLLDGLEKIDWNESLKEMQRNWIGRSEGASVVFGLTKVSDSIEVFTTRPDTLFGATFMVLAPEHELVEKIVTAENKEIVTEYVTKAKNRSERERMTEVKTVTGVFTGAYAVNPFTRQEIPVWVADYVLSGYGTGAIMAVPAHDSRDFAFAKHFGLPIIQVIKKQGEEASDPQTWDESYDAKEGIMINSGFMNGMEVKEAIRASIQQVENMGIGFGKVNYRLRDAIFSRQRYWGEPFPIYYKDGMPYPLAEDQLPLELPPVDKYLPTESGEPPLARAKNWKTKEGYPLETNTMPGFAGSSGYFLRYMDPRNEKEYFSKSANEYWRDVDLYLGGDEHATGHLIYSRFWNKFLFDLGLVCEDEPFKKLINQGKIQGRSSFVYRANLEKMAEYLLWENLKDNKTGVKFTRDYRDGTRKFDFYSEEAKLIIEVKRVRHLKKLTDPYEEYAKEKGLKVLLISIREMLDFNNVLEKINKAVKDEEVPTFVEMESLNDLTVFVSKNYPGREFYTDALHVDVNLVDNDILDIEAYKKWQPHLADAKFVLEDGKYHCGWEVEKMSKSKHNVQNPDDLIERYGADTLRLYEMFLGPLEQDKPWDTKGIEGVFRFLKKLWKLYVDDDDRFIVTNEKANPPELKVLHKTIKKIRGDMERFSFNTGVSAFMICVNELADLKCHKREILEPLSVLISPYSPHIAEELWQMLGHKGGISFVDFPVYDEKYLEENTFSYPVSFNGKLRYKLELPVELKKEEVEIRVKNTEETKKWAGDKTISKVIVVPGKIINIVLQ